jgi:hypothetical protein
MKYVALFAILCCGCGCKCGVGAHTPAAYVRDPYHHCVEDSSPFLSKDYKKVGVDGKVEIRYGWRHWVCADGVTVIISNDEAQP